MKISKIFGDNFAQVSKISVNVEPSVNYILGSNASGKTTIGLDIPWFVLKGLAQRGEDVLKAERFRFIGPHGKSAKGGIEIVDEVEKVTHTITRKLLKSGTELEIKSSDGVQRGQEFLDSLWSAILFNVMKFSELSGKEQALAFGVDTAEFDAKRKELEQERRAVYQDVKRLEGAAETSMGAEKVEAVSLAELLKERKEAEEFNDIVAKQEEAYQDSIEQQSEVEREIRTLEKQLKEAKTTAQRLQKDQDEAEMPPGRQDLTEIDEKIAGAEGTNAKARAYQESLEDQKKAKAKRAEYEAKTTKIEAVDAERTDHIKASKLPYNNTTVDEHGEFRLNGKPFNQTYFSLGECMKFGAKLASKIMAGEKDQDKLLEYVYVPHAESLDEASRAMLFKELAGLGLQVMAEYVSTEKLKGENSILLKEMQVVDSYKEPKAGAALA